MIDAILLHASDNVATAVQTLSKGQDALVRLNREHLRVNIIEDISYGHKFAVRDIAKGEDILKYGEVIGRATTGIASGAHAHVQNIESLRGRGDWKGAN
jgi:altronate dehydratase small subunit